MDDDDTALAAARSDPLHDNLRQIPTEDIESLGW